MRFSELLTIAQNAVARGGMDVDLYSEIAKSVALVNQNSAMMDMQAASQPILPSNPNELAPVAPEMTPSTPEQGMMPNMP
jgi:hypothetical protein